MDMLGKVRAALHEYQGAIMISVLSPRSEITASVDGENN
jgi:hypothetical protein